MSTTSEKIPFAVDMSRLIETLAAQIYPSPLALLRENVQNAYDAILLRRYEGQPFNARIDVTIEHKKVVVADNGIGMSRANLRDHFWRAGSSSKNNDHARAAGVVGTFGIGAMANFGIAEGLTVETETLSGNERTFCVASRSTLSVTEDCIAFEQREPKGNPGTIVTATMQADKSINVAEAVEYITQFVAYLSIDVYVNGPKVSGRSVVDSVPELVRTWKVSKQHVDLGEGFTVDAELTGAISGDMRIVLENILYGSKKLEGCMVLRQGQGTLRTFRSGFGLAATSVSSQYQFGGAADFIFLQPTAGREALVSDSLQLLQRLVRRVDEFASESIATRPESNANANFVRWAHRSRRYDLCSYLRVRIEPGDNIALHEVRDRSENAPVLVYPGNDPSTIKLASEEKPMILLSQNAQRRECEIQYMRKYCKIEELSNAPMVLHLKPETETTDAEKGLAFRIASILLQDYFLEVHIRFGTISQSLPVLVTKAESPVEIVLDPEGATVRIILKLYDSEYLAFGHMTKDFVRNMIFPKVSNLVPSATRQGAEAFLKSIHRTREVFEYETTDLESLTSLWKDYLSGKLTLQQATARAKKVAVRSYQFIDANASAPIRDVVPDVVPNEAATAQHTEPNGPLPPIQRLDMSTDKKVLTIGEGEPPLKGYRCFLAITDRIKDEKGDFFLQPHRTSVVWGGQKALFVFEHHSGDFGLYYDLQTQNVISNQSGGGSVETCTIVMKNRIFIPIPMQIQASFLPQESEKKRFEVRCDILHIDQRLPAG